MRFKQKIMSLVCYFLGHEYIPFVSVTRRKFYGYYDYESIGFCCKRCGVKK